MTRPFTGCPSGARPPTARREYWLRRDVLAAIDRCRDHRGIYRLRNDHQFVIAQRPGGGNS